MKSLLVMALLFVGASNVWAETISTTVASWNLKTASWTKESGFGTSTITINSQSCTYATGELEGLALQGGSGTSWSVNSNGLSQGNGTRNIAILDLKAGDVVTVVTTTSAISGLVNGTSLNGNTTGTCTFTVTADGAFGFKVERYDGSSTTAYTTSIVVNRQVDAVQVSSWDLKTASWAKESGFGTSTITINSQSCTYATGELEGLALQGGSGTSWSVNSNGLSQGNGTRNIAILDLKAGDVVTVVTTTSAISGLVNGTSLNGNTTGTCTFTVTADGAFGFKVERYDGSSTTAYTTLISVLRARSYYEETFDNIKTIAETLAAVPNDNASATSTLLTAISTQQTAFSAATTAAGLTTAISTLIIARDNFVANANPTTGNQFDLTYLLTNPDLEDIADWGSAAAQGWYTDIPTTDMGDYNNFAVRTSLNSSKNAVERYTSNVCTTASTFGLYQKVTLPAGNYSFSANALANNASNIVMAAGNTEGDAVTTSDFAEYGVDFAQASNSEIKLGIMISSEGTNAANWMAMTELKLYKTAPSSVPVTVTAAGMATYVPAYNLNFSGTDIEAYKVKVNTKGTATLTKVDEVPAGTPVLLIGTTDDIPVIASAAAVSDNDLVAGTGAAVATIDGTYTNMILNNGSSGIGFYFANGQTVATNRAYLHILTSLAPDAAAPMMLVFDDGNTTGIDAALMNSEQRIENSVYDLQGRQIVNGKSVNGKLQKGLYIVNGRKVVIK